MIAGAPLLFHFPEHDLSRDIDPDLIGERPERFVSFFQFLPDRNVLRTVLLALSALHALRRERRLLGKAHCLRELEAALDGADPVWIGASLFRMMLISFSGSLMPAETDVE